MQQNDSFAAAIGWIAQLRVRARSVAGVWLMAGLLFLVALALCLDFAPIALADPFVTFYVALIVTTLACGWRVATVFAVCAATAAWYFFLRSPMVSMAPPPGTGATILALASFAVVAAAEICVAEALAHAASILTGGANPAKDPRLNALHRRAHTAVNFVAAAAVPPSESSATESARSLADVRARCALFEQLDRSVLAPTADPTASADDWAERMEAFCQTMVPHDRPGTPLCRISGEVQAISSDRLLGISLAIADMLRETLAAGGAVFEAALRNDGAGACSVDIRTTGVRGTDWDLAATPPWPDISQWLVRLLDATLTISTEGGLALRFDFFD